jgi:hypothetical protein
MLVQPIRVYAYGGGGARQSMEGFLEVEMASWEWLMLLFSLKRTRKRPTSIWTEKMIENYHICAQYVK